MHSWVTIFRILTLAIAMVSAATAQIISPDLPSSDSTTLASRHDNATTSTVENWLRIYTGLLTDPQAPIDGGPRESTFPQAALGRAIGESRSLPITPRERQMYGLWLAICLERSMFRSNEALDADDGTTPPLSYASEMGRIAERVRADLTQCQWSGGDEIFSRCVAQGLAFFSAEVSRMIASYQQDPLCPGFRSPLSDLGATRLFEKLEAGYLPSQRPGFAEALDRIENEEELRLFLTGYFRRLTKMILYNMFIHTLDVDVRNHVKLGRLTFLANNGHIHAFKAPGSWPGMVFLGIKDPALDPASPQYRGGLPIPRIQPLMSVE